MQSEEEDLKKYIYSIVPDYSYIDYFDREYALDKDNLTIRAYYPSAGIVKDNNPMCVIHVNITDGLAVSGYRCLLITALELKEVYRDVNSTNVFEKLNDYDGRHVYALIRDEDSSATSVQIAIGSGSTTSTAQLTDYEGYVMELRF